MGWINIEDEEPPLGVYFIACDAINRLFGIGISHLENPDILYVYSDPNCQMFVDFETTHWMSFPEFPAIFVEDE